MMDEEMEDGCHEECDCDECFEEMGDFVPVILLLRYHASICCLAPFLCLCCFHYLRLRVLDKLLGAASKNLKG